jgi:integrase/recombinase XerD
MSMRQAMSMRRGWVTGPFAALFAATLSAAEPSPAELQLAEIKARIRELAALVRGRDLREHVFLNRCGQPVTRFGIHALVERHTVRATDRVPSLATQRVSTHTIRHTTATHLLRSGVEINTIRAWLGHVSLATTSVYAEVDVEMKAKALASCEVEGVQTGKPWKEDAGLMEFLRTL